MSEHTYKMIELVGSSHTSIEAAVHNAIAKAEVDESTLRWFDVLETRGKWCRRIRIGMTSPVPLPGAELACVSRRQ